MRQWKTGRIICLLILFPVLVLLPTQKGNGENNQIDLSATLEFVANWAKRDAFPESTPFAYYNTYCLLTLGGKLSDETKEKMVNYISACQKSNGGFASGPTIDEPNIIFTYYALKTLDLLDSISSIDQAKAIRFIVSLEQQDGSVKGKPGDVRTNLVTTYYALGSLHLLNALDRIEKLKTIVYIKTHQQTDGFGMMVGKRAAPQSTFMAVKGLELLGALTDDIKSKVVEYLKGTRYSGLTNDQKYSTLPSIEDMAYVVDTASTLSSLNQLNKQKTYEFVESLYVPQNGGFGPNPGLGTTPPSTYFAVLCLDKLGKLKRPKNG